MGSSPQAIGGCGRNGCLLLLLCYAFLVFLSCRNRRKNHAKMERTGGVLHFGERDGSTPTQHTKNRKVGRSFVSSWGLRSLWWSAARYCLLPCRVSHRNSVGARQDQLLGSRMRRQALGHFLLFAIQRCTEPPESGTTVDANVWYGTTTNHPTITLTCLDLGQASRC